jgi:DNA-binding CsgD family transcriptional regulator
LEEALSVFSVLGAVPWEEAVRSELRAAGARSGRTTCARLTEQEGRIAALVAGGATNKETAAALFLSPKTVEFHLGTCTGSWGCGRGVSWRGRMTRFRKPTRSPEADVVSGSDDHWRSVGISVLTIGRCPRCEARPGRWCPRRLPPEALLLGQMPAHEARWPEVEKTPMAKPISATRAWT